MRWKGLMLMSFQQENLGDKEITKGDVILTKEEK